MHALHFNLSGDSNRLPSPPLANFFSLVFRTYIFFLDFYLLMTALYRLHYDLVIPRWLLGRGQRSFSSLGGPPVFAYQDPNAENLYAFPVQKSRQCMTTLAQLHSHAKFFAVSPSLAHLHRLWWKIYVNSCRTFFLNSEPNEKTAKNWLRNR